MPGVFRDLFSKLTGGKGQPPRGPVTAALAALLDDLDDLAQRHPEVLDTDVREQLREVIEEGYLRLSPAYEVPPELGMFTPEGTASLRSLLARHVPALAAAAKAQDASSEEARLRLFEDRAVTSRRGSTFDTYFGAS